MSSSLELVALKLAGPGAAVVVAIAAVAGGEIAGFDVGAAELGGAAIALFMLREVFGFVRWNSERKDPRTPETVVVLPEELREHMRAQARLLREMRDELRAQKQVCVLGDVDARERFFDALERAIGHAAEGRARGG